MGINKKKTSSSIASQAAQTLRDNKASQTAKKLAASALSQTGTSNQTGADMETLASTVLTSSKYKTETKSLAASVLAQSNKQHVSRNRFVCCGKLEIQFHTGITDFVVLDAEIVKGQLVPFPSRETF